MTNELTEAPALIGIGAQSIKERAKSLGLTWTLRPGTVVAPPVEDPAGTQVLYDGDSEPIDSINLTGFFLPVGARVMCAFVPPAGSYVIGDVDQVFLGTDNGVFSTLGAAGSTSSATFSDIPGSPGVAVRKKGTGTQSNLRCRLEMSYFISSSGTTEFGALAGTTTVALARFSPGSTFNYFYIAGTCLIPNLAPGLYTVKPQWRAVSGTANQDGAGWTSFTVDEVAA